MAVCTRKYKFIQEEMRINIKPLSINNCFQGRRFRTKEYDKYEKAVMLQLPNIVVPKVGRLILKVEVAFSNSAADVDNCLKPIIDILQKRYEFNDNRIYRIEIDKVIVKKGFEYIDLFIETM